MPVQFIVKHSVFIATELERVKAIILMPKFWGVRWSHPKLRQALSDIGLDYTAAQIDELNDALHQAGVVEDVVGPVPVPGPEPMPAEL